jgi:indolepyruvate ferredoxin oxidoreductase beta subunit
MAKVRVFFTGVGGQGTLTATTMLAQAAMAKGLHVTTGEVHGMAQRGGVVVSALLIGGFMSPRIAPGEADLLLGFEPLETLRALPVLKKGGAVVSNADPIPPVSVSLGKETYPALDSIKEQVEACAGTCRFLHCNEMGVQAGALQAGNMALIGAACALGVVPVTPDELKETITSRLKAKIVDMNIKAVDLGVAGVS